MWIDLSGVVRNNHLTKRIVSFKWEEEFKGPIKKVSRSWAWARIKSYFRTTDRFYYEMHVVIFMLRINSKWGGSIKTERIGWKVQRDRTRGIKLVVVIERRIS